ncbi:MAG: Anthranilate phosphoribosyltransferase [Burkholderia sp.]|jgi:anthranilate phosphoribosyltransferase
MDARFETLYRRESLSSADTEALFNEVFAGRMEPAALASLLTALKIKGETPEEIRGAATAMLTAARPFPRIEGEIGEIVGTGGDGSSTINVSTTAALTAAACGLNIAKHGNRGVSSPSGASDVLAALGVDITVSPEDAGKLLKETGFAFCYAPTYHPAMRFAAPVRKALGTRTIFNILGPLTNPAHPDYALIGVYDPSLLQPVAETLRLLGMKRGMVVYGSGTDEAAIHGKTQFVRFDESGKFENGEFHPADFGVDRMVTLSELKGGNPQDNARIAEAVLSGAGTYAQHMVVRANLALLLMLGKKADTLPEALQIAEKALNSGAGLKVLEAHRAFARSRAAEA